MKKEEYKQSLIAYKKGFYEMRGLCQRMLRDMRRQMNIDMFLMGMWAIVGIFWGITFVRWLS